MNEFTLVKEVIDEWDPLNLLAIHCPDDEYDGEIGDIVKLLPNVKSVDELSLGIHKVFVKWFGEDFLEAEKYSIQKCNPIAIKIWNRIFDK
ncbi:DUF1871 family protein [Priestia abyssalis]|uniref:DUF1871 family protein n=1 Tax=Priestia abyssalis TaxID=1221450 RepID=UPI000995C036|nr:DUF1871 family protein [Priestia abyssalis]